MKIHWIHTRKGDYLLEVIKPVDPQFQIKPLPRFPTNLRKPFNEKKATVLDFIFFVHGYRFFRFSRVSQILI